MYQTRNKLQPLTFYSSNKGSRVPWQFGCNSRYGGCDDTVESRISHLCSSHISGQQSTFSSRMNLVIHSSVHLLIVHWLYAFATSVLVIVSAYLSSVREFHQRSVKYLNHLFWNTSTSLAFFCASVTSLHNERMFLIASSGWTSVVSRLSVNNDIVSVLYAIASFTDTTISSMCACDSSVTMTFKFCCASVIFNLSKDVSTGSIAFLSSWLVQRKYSSVTRYSLHLLKFVCKSATIGSTSVSIVQFHLTILETAWMISVSASTKTPLICVSNLLSFFGFLKLGIQQPLWKIKCEHDCKHYQEQCKCEEERNSHVQSNDFEPCCIVTDEHFIQLVLNKCFVHSMDSLSWWYFLWHIIFQLVKK